MVVRFRKKVRRQRGYTGHGWGTKKKHRGSGSQGGHGAAGMHKHKYSLTTSYDTEHFTKKGFCSMQKRQKVINVGDLEKLKSEGNDIDLAKLGYTKLLSRGNVKKALNIKVFSYSAGAKKKIEKAGGKIIK